VWVGLILFYFATFIFIPYKPSNCANKDYKQLRA
jgi:hypothetical protein